MKKLIILIALTCTVTARAQENLPERVWDDVRRNAEWTLRSEASMASSRAVSSIFRKGEQARRNARKDRKTWECPHCHRQNSGNFCPDCGTGKPETLTGWTCPDCGRHNDGGAYCEHCGSARATRQPEPIRNTVSTPRVQTPAEQTTITLEQLSRMTAKNPSNK